jgi:hypothetical protein
VTAALELRLEKERRHRGKSGTAEEILAFAQRFSPGMKEGSTSAGHAQLYDEDGMPA